VFLNFHNLNQDTQDKRIKHDNLSLISVNPDHPYSDSKKLSSFKFMTTLPSDNSKQKPFTSDTSQQELFLSIFLQNEMAFEIDDLSEKLNLIHSLDEKFNREIDKAILRHLQGKLFKNDTPANRPKRSNIRTICMLLGLKFYYESESTDFWPNIPKEAVSFVDESNKEWTLSYPLLLIQIINFSQWEWNYTDYNYEYYSALRAYEEFNKLLNKAFSDNDNNSNKDNKETLLKTIARLIRWHTLRGQQQRGSASSNIFGVDDSGVLNVEDEYLANNENALLNIITCVDGFLKEGKSKNEKIVEKTIAVFDGNNSLDILNKLKDETYKKKFVHNSKEEKDSVCEINYIWSYFPEESGTLKGTIINKIKENEQTGIIHVNLDRGIRDMIYDHKKLNSIKKTDLELDKIELPKQPCDKCFPHEAPYIVRVNPDRLL
ncbi:MAG: hypothetical protein HQK65_18070, partial [Desulfamplus sp.]|nr:hypothetical protein [Desulfamplus sp.]